MKRRVSEDLKNSKIIPTLSDSSPKDAAVASSAASPGGVPEPAAAAETVALESAASKIQDLQSQGKHIHTWTWGIKYTVQDLKKVGAKTKFYSGW